MEYLYRNFWYFLLNLNEYLTGITNKHDETHILHNTKILVQTNGTYLIVIELQCV